MIADLKSYSKMKDFRNRRLVVPEQELTIDAAALDELRLVLRMHVEVPLPTHGCPLYCSLKSSSSHFRKRGEDPSFPRSAWAPDNGVLAVDRGNP